MKKNYIKPEINVLTVVVNDIITASSASAYLINKGENGEPMTESYGSLFGKN